MKQHFILPSSPPNEIRKADRSTDFRDMLMLRRSPRQRDERLWGSTLSRIIKFQTSIKNNKKKKEENETRRGTRKHFVLSHRLRSSPRNLSSIQKLFPIPGTLKKYRYLIAGYQSEINHSGLQHCSKIPGTGTAYLTWRGASLELAMICLPTDSTWPAATTADWVKKQNCGCRPPTCTQHISLVMRNRIMRRLLGISMEQADSEQLRQKAKNVTSRYKGKTLSASSAECECYVNFF